VASYQELLAKYNVLTWESSTPFCHGLTWKPATRTRQPLLSTPRSQRDGEENGQKVKLMG